jgi:uncharacterized protein (UPF0548 family)
MSYKQSILKITRNREFLKIIKKLYPARIIVTFCSLIPVFIPEALAIDLDAGGKAFFEPVVAFSKVYTPVAIFIGGVAGLAFTPGRAKNKNSRCCRRYGSWRTPD